MTTTNIDLTAYNGIVTLNGSVPSHAEKAAAERATQSVEGEKAIAEERDVILRVDHHRGDSDIAEAVVSSFQSNVSVPKTDQATVENGWVTLQGAVRFGFERTAALEAVKFLSGVKGVINKIAMKPVVEAAAIKKAIE